MSSNRIRFNKLSFFKPVIELTYVVCDGRKNAVIVRNTKGYGYQGGE